MNIDNLEIGKAYKNYKQLCEVLGELTRTGKSKRLQLADWERHFKYSKSGHNFIINEICETPTEKTDLRINGNNKVKYIDKIEKLVLDLLVQDGNEGQVFLSKNKLLSTLKMVNDNYSYGKSKPFKLSKLTKVTRKEIDDFYEISDSMLKRNLEAALTSLRNQALITWKNSLTVCYVDTQIEQNNFENIKAFKTETFDIDGDIDVTFGVYQPTQKMIHRKATSEEEQLIIRTERNVLLAYNCKVVADVFKMNKAEQFYKDVRDVLFETSNIYLYYNSYEIISNKDQIIEEWKSLERAKTQRELNDDIVEKLNINTANRHDKSFSKYEETKKSKYKIRMTDTYVENNHKLTDTLIKRGADSIKYIEVS